MKCHSEKSQGDLTGRKFFVALCLPDKHFHLAVFANDNSRIVGTEINSSWPFEPEHCNSCFGPPPIIITRGAQFRRRIERSHRSNSKSEAQHSFPFEGVFDRIFEATY